MIEKKIAIIGGCGHVGLPLGVKMSLAGARTTLVDLSQSAVDAVNSGKFPFVEKDGNAQLASAIKKGLRATTDIKTVTDCDAVVFVIGTPVDEHLNPKLSDIIKVFDAYANYLAPETLIIMRSTLFPKTMEHLYNRIKQRGMKIKLAFCPERVSQGFALDEIDNLPQIVSAFEEDAFEEACAIFSQLAPKIIRLTPLEAEMTKLMANSWRYLEFAIANQFYMICEKSGVDFYRVYDAIRMDYPRAKGYKSPGFAAGPCLFKDTMQLASYYDNQFYFGHSAMLVNEGLATFVVERANQILENKMWGKTVGILGLAFKADNDDIRESLSFKVKKGLEFLGANVIAHDPFIPTSTNLEDLKKNSDLIVLCTPHTEYKNLKLFQPLIDVWSFFPREQIETYPGNIKGEK